MRVVIRSLKGLALSLIVLFGVALAPPTFAGTQLWDFEEKHDDWKVANGNWEIKGGVYHVDKGGRAEHSLIGEEKWDDYTIEAKVRLDEHNWAGIVFRAQSEMEYYVYYLNVPNNIVELWRHKKGDWTARDNIVKTPPVQGVKIENGKWIDMKVVVEGSEFAVYLTVNFRLRIKMMSTKPVKSGCGHGKPRQVLMISPLAVIISRIPLQLTRTIN